MGMPYPWPVLAWFGFLCVCGIVEMWCAHVEYDYGLSKRAGCTRLKHTHNQSCFSPVSGCLEAATLMMLSPRSLSNLAGMGGPLFSWLPLLALRGELALTNQVLARTMIWYLAVIGLTRHLHLLTGWDPSGHAIVYGAQLVPLWHLWESEPAAGRRRGLLPTVSRLWLLAWAGVLFYLSGMTAVAFHTLSETMAAAALMLALSTWLTERDAPRVVDRGHVASAAVLWAVPTALSWMADSTSPPLLTGMLVYDLAVWLCFILVLGEGRAELLRD